VVDSAPTPLLVVLAFDFGLRRIGVASGNTLTQSAAPLAVVSHGTGGPDWAHLDRLMRDHGPGQLVVGLPYNVDGTPGELLPATDDFAAHLAARYGKPVARVDERYSSREATAELVARRRAGTRRHRIGKQDIDSLAAALILERWLAGEGSGNRRTEKD
jgi:putative Holliday junction resolvase